MSDILSSFDINEMVKYLNQNPQFKNIGIQFDKELQNEIQIDFFKIIKHLLKEKIIFIIGDTSYGNCCCDETTALHLDCDIIIRVGNSCFTNNIKNSYLLSFSKFYVFR